MSKLCQVFVEKSRKIFHSDTHCDLTMLRQMVHNCQVTSLYSIRAVAEQTGLSAHTIRAWERRYGFPAPVRTASNRRVYGEEDVLRLRSLKRAVASGHSIGLIVSLPADELDRLVGSTARDVPTVEGDNPSEFVRLAMRALRALDAPTFEACLVRSSMVLGIDVFVDNVVVSLMDEVGRSWENGDLSIAQEHLASAVVKAHLERVRLSMQATAGAPMIIAGTPSGQIHEIGAMMAAITAARMDWRVTYLGPDLPAQELADAAVRTRAQAVALSIVHPFGDSKTIIELRKLGNCLPSGVEILVGGEAAESYSPVISEIGASLISNMSNLRERLSDLRGRLAAQSTR